MAHWVTPVDPECPEVIEERKILDDPITTFYGMGDEIVEEFDKNHIKTCERCQEYGAANIDIQF